MTMTDYMNQFKTVLLLGSLTAVLLFVGMMLGGASGLTFAFIFVLLMNLGSYFYSDKIVLFIYRAKETDKKSNPKLFTMVEEIAKTAGIPMPKVYIIPSEQSNAFATGRNPEHAAVAFTKGILSLLSDEELKGVIAHEISHIKNRDILISTIAATIAGVISYVAMMARWAAIFGGIGGRDSDAGENILEFLVLAILAPILAVLIQLAISRSREYLADETGAAILKKSTGLASALKRLEEDANSHPMRLGNYSTAHMFITNPFSGKALMNLFSTHPSIEKRVARLKQMKF